MLKEVENLSQKSQPEDSLRDELGFVVDILQKIAETVGDRDSMYAFLKANLVRFDRELLETLPVALEKLIEVRDKSIIANLFCSFGDLIQEFPLGDRKLNLEIAITAYELALQIYTRKAFPQGWAMIQNNLAIVYSERIKGDRAENIEQAITAYELALQVYTRKASPQDWAMTQNNLAAAYSYRIKGERAENIERAITAHILALLVRTRKAFPQDWATTQNNLATAYSNRIKGERAENIERAITAYKLALQVYTCEAFPQQWAMTQNNLAIAYSNRIKGERAENIEQAITTYKLALQVRTREAFPQDWATTQDNLAAALINRSQLTDNSTDLDMAIVLIQEVLSISTPHSPHFINSQYRLGSALTRRYEQSQNPTDLQQAVQAYQIALQSLDPEHYDREWMWTAIPETQSILGSRLVKDGRWQEGLQLLLNSLNQLSQGNNPLAHANALYQTGQAHEALSDWDNARLYYRDALRLFQHLDHQLGIARAQAGLGGVLVSQGHLQKGIAELSAAYENYQQLQQPDQAAEVEMLRQIAQQALELQTSEAYPA